MRASSQPIIAEDFCINARERHRIDVQVFPLRFQHYSHGNITERYHAGLRYLAAKYPDTAVPGSCSFIGGRAHELERHFRYQVRADRDATAPTRALQRLRMLARRAAGSRLVGIFFPG